ncbi:MAG: DNA sulfur modification protein DndD [Cyanobacteriota bacterium]|nr:DNA sulfur modification protein DndD [Cyanobacteriota bacterium]
MIFRQLVLQNFGPYLNRQVLELATDTSPDGSLRPIILLGGMNGGGKTTLMDAIRLAFYGSRAQCSTRGNLSYNDFLTQCVNRNARPTDETLIELAFDRVYNNKLVTFRIRRRWTRNPKQGKDTLEIICDTWLDEAITKTWDERVEYILPLGISNLFLFDGEQVKELADLDVPPPTVVEAIQSLLGLELAERLSADIDILVQRKRKELASAKELANIDELEQKIVDLKDKREQAALEKASLETKCDRAEKKYRDASNKFITEGGKIAADRAKLETQHNSSTAAAQQTRDRLREIAETSLPLALISPLLQTARQQGERELQQTRAIAARDLLRDRDRRLLDYLNSISLSGEKVKDIKTFLTQENQELERAIDPNLDPWLDISSDSLNSLGNLLDREIPVQIEAAKRDRVQLKTIEEEIVSLEQQLQTAASPETYQKLEKNVTKAQSELLQTQKELEKQRQELNVLETRLKTAIKDLETYSRENIDRDSNEHLIQSAAKVQQTLKQFRQRLTLKKLNKLEVEVTACFRHLLHKSNLVRRVAIDSKTFSLALFDPQGQPLPKHRLSAGEKQLLAIAFLWGLARVSGRNLPVAIDTPLGRLDSSHRNNLVERYFPQASSQVILLSTDTEIGPSEAKQLREQDAIAREYLLKYDAENRHTTVESGYFW